MHVSPGKLAALFGASAVVGVALWRGFALVEARYDEQANPWWLVGWFWVSGLLFVAGAVGVFSALVVAAVRRGREA